MPSPFSAAAAAPAPAAATSTMACDKVKLGTVGGSCNGGGSGPSSVCTDRACMDACEAAARGAASCWFAALWPFISPWAPTAGSAPRVAKSLPAPSQTALQLEPGLESRKDAIAACLAASCACWRERASALRADAKLREPSSLLWLRSKKVRRHLLRRPLVSSKRPNWRSAFQSRSRCCSVLLCARASPILAAPNVAIPFNPRFKVCSDVLPRSAPASCVAPSGPSSLRRKERTANDREAVSAGASKPVPVHLSRLNPKSSSRSVVLAVMATANALAPGERMRFHERLRCVIFEFDSSALATAVAPSDLILLSDRFSEAKRHVSADSMSAAAINAAPSDPIPLSCKSSEVSPHMLCCLVILLARCVDIASRPILNCAGALICSCSWCAGPASA
mmetsp:Transcript_56175/g.90951  ORF Transcript_56175/g.90951 Transcript_56175/m.90951 type:complete len:393 (+) Transcript_56175:699-1877(+)